ncbi:hypothetical protein AB3X94_09395 [Paraburkholderia sp. BR10923]|uniref:hypothetical protein n=1 Tax=Paraburkholderia sp. BR10923 TaxID=3236992 RepID=UPI0034CFF632
MKKLLAAVLPVLLTAHVGYAQSIVSASSSAYAPRYVAKHSQLDAMTPHAASSPTLYGSPSDLAYAKKNRYVAPNMYTQTKNSLPKQKRTSVAQPVRGKNSADPYGSDLWNSDQTYASPETSDPYSVR